MSFRKLLRIKEEHPSLSKRLDDLVAYVLRQLDAGNKELVPALAAQSLETSEAEALGLLMLLEDKSLLKSAYDVYCHEKGTFLKRVRVKKDIPQVLYCKFCDEDHCDLDALEVQLVFLVDEKQWQSIRHDALV